MNVQYHPRMSLSGLICCILMAVLLLAAFVPAADKAREQESRVRCALNLRYIGLSMVMYANAETKNGMSFPRTYFDPNAADHPKLFTNWKQPLSFGKSAPQANDVTAAFYLLFKTQKMDPAWLVCPGAGKKPLQFARRPSVSDQEMDQGPDGLAAAKEVADSRPLAASPRSISNFPGIEYMSYSWQNPYPGIPALQTGFKWSLALDSDFALVADLNPGGKAEGTVKPDSSKKQLQAANSPNHGGAGQNVLYADGHVDFAETPFCGRKLQDMTQDNIYTRRAGSSGDPVLGPPMDHDDNILLPAADWKPTEQK